MLLANSLIIHENCQVGRWQNSLKKLTEAGKTSANTFGCYLSKQKVTFSKEFSPLSMTSHAKKN